MQEGDSCLNLIRVREGRDDQVPSMTLESRLHPIDVHNNNDIDRVRVSNENRIAVKSIGGGVITVSALDGLSEEELSTLDGTQMPPLCSFLPSSVWVPGGLGLDWSNSNEALIVSSCKDGKVSLHDIASGATQVTTAHQTPGCDTNDTRWSSGSADLFASVGEDGSISFFDMRALAKPSHTFQGHHFGANSISFSSDDSLIATGGADKALKVWDVRTLSSNGMNVKSLFNWKSHRSPVIQIEWSPSQPHSLASADSLGLIFFWSTNLSAQDREAALHPKRPEIQMMMGGHGRAVNDLSIHRDGTVVSVSSAIYDKRQVDEALALNTCFVWMPILS